MSEYVGVPNGVRKCPIHKTWIKSSRSRQNGTDIYKRYCEQCELAKPQDTAAPQKKPNVRLGTL